MVGGETLYNNRFKDLDPDPIPGTKVKNKRKRYAEIGLEFDDDHIPRYVVAKAIGSKPDQNVPPLSSHNVFQIEKLQHISKEYTEVTELKSGDFLIKTNNLKAAQKCMKASYIDLIPVQITLHTNLNSSQGRIYSKKIINISDEELTKYLADQKVISVKKILKKENDNLIPTGAAIITFDLIHRPEKLNIGWEKVQVYEYIPNPL
ncbi:PREDICTED: uncharacterized protein LOC108357841, partial [Rhagoletis zephyria]|uniref:uncharacterized protein LOC108357841 n=1 Tax=Rhagoletis zephyria TaxID=28612 RepID=UPI000811668D